MKSERPNHVQAWTYVLVQAVLLALLVFLDSNLGPQVHRLVVVGRTLESLGIIGVLVSAASLRRSLTVVPIPKEAGQLSTTGLYRYVRHPMYTSVLLLALGISVSSGSLAKYLLTFLLYVLFHLKSTYEERFLKQKYPDYANYAARIPRFIPFIK